MKSRDLGKTPLFQVIDGRPAMEPNLPPFHLCGGLQSPYYPCLTEKQLHAIMLHPEVNPSEAQFAWCELGRRRRGK